MTAEQICEIAWVLDGWELPDDFRMPTLEEIEQDLALNAPGWKSLLRAENSGCKDEVKQEKKSMKGTERRLSRREALLGAGIVGAGALAAMSPAGAAASNAGASGLEGAWLLTVTPDSGTASPHQVLALYTKGGGVAIATSNPPSGGSTGFGVWIQTGDNQYLETFELFTFNPSGAPTGILMVRALATLETVDQLSGRAQIDFQPMGSPSFFPAGSTHFVGARIEALALT